MAPLQVIALAVVILFYTGLPEPKPGAPVAGGAPGLSAGWIILLAIATHLMLALVVAARTRRAARLLHRLTVDGQEVAFQIDSLIGWVQWTIVALAATQLWQLGLGPVTIGDNWVLGRFAIAGEAMTLATITWVALWTVNYRVAAAMRERSVAYRLAQGLPVHVMPSLGQYVIMQARHNFFLLVPIGMALAIDYIAQLAGGKTETVVWVTTKIGLILAMPWMITRIWHTTPLTGPLRGRLIAVAREHYVRFRNILVWRTHNNISNAAILGYLPFARYFLMTDSLLETLADRQAEAVFAHEVGHGYHRHIWWYLAALGGGLASSLWLGENAIYVSQKLFSWPMTEVGEEWLGSVLQVGLVALFMAWGFSRISRCFEHQADWFSARHMAESLAREPERLSTMTLGEYMSGKVEIGRGVSTAPVEAYTMPPPEALTPQEKLTRGAEIFSGTLRMLLTISQRPLDRGGWLHPSFTRRSELLYRLAGSPEEVRAFNRRMLEVRLVIAVLAAAGLAAMWPDIHDMMKQMLDSLRQVSG